METMPALDQKMIQETLDYREIVNGMMITDQETLSFAGTILADLKDARKKREAFFKPMKDAANAAKQAILDREHEAIDPIKDLEGIVNTKLDVFATAQRRIQEAELRRLELEAAKKADEERKALMDQAVAEEAKGNKAAAEMILEEAENVYTAPVMVTPAIQKTTQLVSGSMTLIADYELAIINPMDLMKEIVAGRIPLDCVTLDLAVSKMKSHISAHKITEIKGLNIRETTRSSNRGRR